MSIGLFLAYAIPISFLIALLLGSVLSLAFTQKYVNYVLLGYLVIHFAIPGSTWGAEEYTRPIYGRGSGQLFLSFINWALIGFYLIRVFVDKWQGYPNPMMTLRPFFILFNIMFLGHILVGSLLDVPLKSSAGGGGIMYVSMMTLLVFLIVRAIREPKDLNRLGTVFLLVVLGRGLYGLIRFAFFGGDPINPYANYEGLNVKLVFFDINDGLLATMAAVYALWKLSWEKHLTNWERVFYWLVLAVEIVVVLLSYRRTGWLGMGIALAAVVWLLPKTMKFLLAAGIALSVPIVVVLNAARFSSGKSASEFQGLISSISGQATAQGTRAAEWAMAMDTIRHNVFLGSGTWGELGQGIISWHFGAYGFVHSTILHLWMKTGLVGLGLFFGAIIAWAFFLIKLLRRLAPEQQLLAVVGMAGVLFLIPSFIAGTPTIEWRTMQLFGFALALPYAVHNAMTRNSKSA